MNQANKALAARLKEVAEERLAMLWDDDRFKEDVAAAKKRWSMTEREAIEHATHLQVQRHTESACDVARFEERMAILAIAEAMKGGSGQ